MITKIRKRDGRLVDYDISKIENAIAKAMMSIGDGEIKDCKKMAKITARARSLALPWESSRVTAPPWWCRSAMSLHRSECLIRLQPPPSLYTHIVGTQ